jgi:hypothetical protein
VADACARVAGRPNIYEAVSSGDVQLVKDHLAAGACVNQLVQDARGEVRSLLHVAVDNENVDMCRLLISAKADVNATTRSGGNWLDDGERSCRCIF